MSRASCAPVCAASLLLLVAACGVSPTSTSGPAAPPTASAAAPTAAPTVTATAVAATVEPPAAPPPEPPPPEPIRARFLSVGDVIFGRRVQKKIDEKNDPEHPFRPLASLYQQMDFTFANLENPFFSGKKPNVTPPGKRYAVLWSKPDHVKSLVKYKFTAVNLANNHAMDQDLKGLEETIKTLDDHGIVHFGAGPDLAAAWKPKFVDVRGLKIAFIGASFTSKNDMGITRNNYVARIEDENRLAAACKEARAGSHFVVVTMHAGDEHKVHPNPRQKMFAKAAVKHCADIVIGAHPHVVQPAVKIDGKWVFYSLGNFIFDQAAVENKEAFAVELRLKLPPGGERAEIEKLTIHPVVIEEHAPGPADEARAAKILERIGVPGRELVP